MTTPELESLVRDLMARPEEWEARVSHDPDQRRYELLLRDDDVEVWLICWMEDHDTGFHDHDLSGGAVGVVAGAVREDRLVLGGGTVSRVAHAGDAPAVTVHAYSPPLWRMGAYEIGDGGELRRHSVSYAEELRPRSASVVMTAS
jgi:hypothetical protein